MFAHLIHKFFDGEQKKAYLTLQVVRDQRRGKHPFSKHSLPKVLKDETPITYAMLESFAREANVPTWLLLLFTRSLSDSIDFHKPDGKISELEREEIGLNVERTIRFLGNIRDRLDPKQNENPLTMSHLDEWIELYLATEPTQDDLKLPLPDK